MGEKRKALGKGLAALLKDPQENVQTAEEKGAEEVIRSISELPVDRIQANPYQPRTFFDEESLNELSDSIRELGVIQPITVRRIKKNKYELISGERRLKAARRAGLSTIPAFVREADSEAMLEMAIVENVQREQLNPIEIALGYQRLIDECALTQEQVAHKVGKNRSTVANFLRLLNLPPLIQAGLRDGVLTTGHARALLPLEDETLQRSLLDEIRTSGMSVREVEQRVRELLKPGRKPSTSTTRAERAVSVEMAALSDRLRRAVGTKVHIRPAGSGKGGRVELEYYSDEDLERIVEFFDH